MAWDSRRPIPWRRLLTEWLILTVVTGVVFAVVVKEQRGANYVALVVGGGFYVVLGAVLAKFGYQRKTLKQLRVETRAQQAAAARQRAVAGPTASRTGRPQATRRTNAGNRRPPGRR